MGTGTSTSSGRSSTPRRPRSSSRRGVRAKTLRAGRGVALRELRRLLLTLPGVEEGPCYGTPGFRVEGKFLARLREDGVTLVVKCGDEQRDMWMEADPAAFFVTDHYRGYGSVLIRLPVVAPGVLRELLVPAWRRLAPKRLVSQYEARKPG